MGLNIKLIAVVAFVFGFVILDTFFLNITISGNSERLWKNFQKPASVNSSRSTAAALPKTNLAPPSSSIKEPSKYILETALCRIPRTDIMPHYFKARWRVDRMPDCDYEKVLGKVTADNILELLPEYRYSNCSIQEVGRTAGKDTSYTLSPPEIIEYDTPVHDKEMYVVKCNNSFNFEANLPIHPQVREKMKYWQEKIGSNPESAPINVLFLGIDTVSRSHAFRSIPKTMAFLKEMGFHDFQGYHSVAPSTLTNFMGFLIGLQRTEVRESCTPSWSSQFDSCPFIWKNFSAQNYVTMYAEDGEQTFNWGGQSGFKEKPTDYYIHSLFNAIEKIRVDNLQFKKTTKMKDLHAYCASSETVPQFLTRYTKRFVQKFRNTPFFSFTWYAYPFHDYNYALGSFDNELLSLFQYFNSLPSLLSNTLIAFVSDHGERDGFFKSEGVEGYIERGLPPLFIRVPERLLNKYPEMNLNAVMADNANQLTAPFDIHHTFLHLLQLSGLNGSSNGNEFKPVLPNRASLFVPIEGANTTRDCKTLNIFPDSCVCNTLVDIETVDSPYYLGKMTAVLQAKLRSMVKDSGYVKKCAEWTVKTGDVISAQVVAKEKGSTTNLIRFAANPGNANFEAKIRVIQKNSRFDKCEIMGSLNRINIYGNQSACVGAKTDRDKEMKAFCMCKDKVVKSKNGFK